MLAQMVRGWNEMSLYRKIRRVISIFLIGVGIWALTPYLYNREVNEDFPAPAAQPAQQQNAAQPAAAQPETKKLIAGTFTNGLPGHSAEGRAVVYELDGGKRSLRLEDFSVTNGPDLFVVLSPNADPASEGIGSSYVQLEALKGNTGSQNYELAADVDLNAFKSIVIWCRSFNVVFGFAPLQSANAMPHDAAMAQDPTASDATMMQETASDAAMMNSSAPAAKAPASAGPVALHTGSFVAGPFPGDSASGKATIYALEDGKQALRLEDFSATNGPDLFVVLSPNADPGKDGIGDTYTQLAALKGNKGNQNYELASDLDLSGYKSVVIWCRTFNVVFGYATLQPAS